MYIYHLHDSFDENLSTGTDCKSITIPLHSVGWFIISSLGLLICLAHESFCLSDRNKRLIG